VSDVLVDTFEDSANQFDEESTCQVWFRKDGIQCGVPADWQTRADCDCKSRLTFICNRHKQLRPVQRALLLQMVEASPGAEQQGARAGATLPAILRRTPNSERHQGRKRGLRPLIRGQSGGKQRRSPGQHPKIEALTRTLAPRLGLEPRTCRLTAGCSAN
jgi:hypothetical protein